MPAATLPDEVRASAAAIVAGATAVRIDRERMDALTWPGDAPAPARDPARHHLEGTETDVAAYLLTVDAVNFGSGRFFHGERTTLELIRETGRSAAALAQAVAGDMALWADRGFYKRAQLLASDLDELFHGFAAATRRPGPPRGTTHLALAGVATFGDLDRLTIFADNLVPHVLRCDGVLVYDPRLAAHVDGGRLLAAGPWEREIRGCAVHACAALAPRLGLTEQALDHVLWSRGQAPEHKARPRHRCRTVIY